MPPNEFNQGQAQVYSNSPSPRPAFFRRRLVRYGLLFAIIIVAGAIILSLLPKQTPKSKATSFVSYVLESKSAQAYDLTSSNFQQSTPSGGWASLVQSFNNLCQGQLKFVSVSMPSNTTATTTLSTTSKAGSCNIEVDLIHSSGKWEVNNFNATQS